MRRTIVIVTCIALLSTIPLAARAGLPALEGFAIGFEAHFAGSSEPTCKYEGDLAPFDPPTAATQPETATFTYAEDAVHGTSTVLETFTDGAPGAGCLPMAALTVTVTGPALGKHVVEDSVSADGCTTTHVDLDLRDAALVVPSYWLTKTVTNACDGSWSSAWSVVNPMVEP